MRETNHLCPCDDGEARGSLGVQMEHGQAHSCCSSNYHPALELVRTSLSEDAKVFDIEQRKRTTHIGATTLRIHVLTDSRIAGKKEKIYGKSSG